MQQIEDVGLGRDAGLEGHVDSAQHDLFIMLEDQGQDLDHLAITAGLAQHMTLQLTEGARQFHEGRAIPERPDTQPRSTCNCSAMP